MSQALLKRIAELEKRAPNPDSVGFALSDEERARLLSVGLDPAQPMPEPRTLSLPQLRAVASIFLPNEEICRVDVR